MGNPGAFHPSITLQAFTVFSFVAVFAAHHIQGGEDGCPPFSCGHLQDIRPPFRRRGDPLECGVEAYELGCTSSKATIHINTGTYYVTAINSSSSYFWIMDPNFNTNSSCSLPLWNHVPYSGRGGKIDSDSPGFFDLVTRSPYAACFANCSRAITNNSAYKPVACLSANNSHVYVWVSDRDTGSGYCMVEDLEPYCGYLAMIPFGDWNFFDWSQLQNASYVDITRFISKGFTVRFPVDFSSYDKENFASYVNICRNNSTR